MAKNEDKQSRKEPEDRKPESCRPEDRGEEPSFEREVSEGRELVERTGEKVGKKLGKKAEDQLRKLRE